jgi:cytochrome bd-type quinol oxidase subunit 2
MNDPEFGSELRRRQTPQFAAEQRRRTSRALLFGVVLGLATLGDAIYARGHGGMVDGGPYNHFLKLPWWMVAPIGLAVLAACLWALWRMARERL